MNPSSLSRAWRVLAATPIALVTIACAAEPAPPDPQEDTDTAAPRSDEEATPKKKDGATPKAPAGGAAKCPYDGPPVVDVSTMPACRGAGRCVPAGAVPKEQQAQLATCDGGGFCVAEDLVAYAGAKLMTSCKSLAGGEGRCMSRVFPGIDEQKDRLPQDACKETERCAPCFDPSTGAATGVCNLISCDAPKEPAKVFAACCKNAAGAARGKCVPKSTMKPEEADQLAQKECEASDVCAPAESFDPKFVPTKCKGTALFVSYDGVCISTCVPRDFLAQVGTSQGSCDAEHFCAPCKNPLTGEPTGAPGCGP